jgi:hypothetical protein
LVDVCTVVKASAVRRLGEPSLVAYLVRAWVGVEVVLASLVAMHFGAAPCPIPVLGGMHNDDRAAA